MTTFTASVTTATTPLDLNSAAYQIAQDGWDSPVKWRRQIATSPYVHGGVVVDAVRDLADSTLTVHVRGTSQANLESNIAALVSAFSQDTYTLTFGFDGTSWSWTCYTADYLVNMAWARMRARVVDVVLNFPRDPTPVSGAW